MGTFGVICLTETPTPSWVPSRDSPPTSDKTSAIVLEDSAMTAVRGVTLQEKASPPHTWPLLSLIASRQISRLTHKKNCKIVFTSRGKTLGPCGKRESKGVRPWAKRIIILNQLNLDAHQKCSIHSANSSSWGWLYTICSTAWLRPWLKHGQN